MISIAAAPIAAAFKTFGEVAIIAPETEARMVRVIRATPDDDTDLIGRPVRRAATALEIMAADAAGLVEGVVVEVGVSVDAAGAGIVGTGERRVVQGEPQANDRLRLTMLIDTRPE